MKQLLGESSRAGGPSSSSATLSLTAATSTSTAHDVISVHLVGFSNVSELVEQNKWVAVLVATAALRTSCCRGANSVNKIEVMPKQNNPFFDNWISELN